MGGQGDCLQGAAENLYRSWHSSNAERADITMDDELSNLCEKESEFTMALCCRRYMFAAYMDRNICRDLLLILHREVSA